MNFCIIDSIVFIFLFLTSLFAVYIGVKMLIKLNHWVDDTARLISEEIYSRLKRKNSDV